MNKTIFPYRMTIGTRAFSLVEVVVALSVVSFCLISLLGLIPVGLRAYNNAIQQAGASNCMREISRSIQNATPSSADPTSYEAYYGSSDSSDNFTWTVGAPSSTYLLTNLSIGGVPTTSLTDQTLAAHIEIVPPVSASTTGTAYISVAWPKAAVWDEINKKWKYAHGAVTSCVLFLPTQ